MSTYIKQTLKLDAAIEVEPAMPVVLNCSTDVNKTFTKDSGQTVYVRKPDFGGALTSGIDVSSANGGVVQAEVPVTLAAKSGLVTISSLESAVEAGNVSEMVVAPRMSTMGAEIQRDALEVMFLNAGAAKVVDSGTGDYKHIRAIGAVVDSSRIVGQNYFATSPVLGSEIKDSGLGFFQASGLDKTFESSAMGKIDRIETMTTPDITTITAGTKTLGSGTAMRVKTKVATEGATGFIIEVNGGTATLTGGVKKGEIVYLTGYYGVDVHGNATTSLFPFIAQEDVSAVSNEIAYVCQPIYFTGPNKNVSVAVATGIAANTVVTFGLASGATYKKAILWKKPSVVFANRMIADIDQCENTTITTLKGISFLQTRAGNGLTGQNSIIWRFLYGTTVTYCQGVAVLFVKV